MAKSNNISNRVKKVRSASKKNKADALLVTKVENVTYLTGFLGDDSWALVTPKKTYLITDSRFTEQAKGECQRCVIIEKRLTG
jgi:Xaa-Pro aminopeptidase